jgi:LVIVD repeat
MLSPQALAKSRGRSVALVTADLESRLVAIDLVTGARVKTVRTHPDPRSIQTVVSTAVVAHTARGALSLIDGGTLSVRTVIDGLQEPRYAVGSPAGDGRYAYVTDSGLGGLVVIDIVRGRVAGRLALGGPARHVSVDRSGRYLWAALGTAAERIAVVDVGEPTRPHLLGRIRPAFLAHDVASRPAAPASG